MLSASLMQIARPVLLCVFLVNPVTHIVALADKALAPCALKQGDYNLTFMEIPMRIRKGSFKIREYNSGDTKWSYYDGSYGNDYPFYVHRKENEKWWTLSHMSTGYMIRKSLTLKQARQLSNVLKEWPLFLMPTIETITHQKSLLSTYKQQTLNNIIHNLGETNE